MKILPIHHTSTQRPQCQNNVCKVAASPPVPIQQPQPSLPPQEPAQTTEKGCGKCNCDCEKRVVVIQNNTTTSGGNDHGGGGGGRYRGGDGDGYGYGRGFCYPSACYLDPCAAGYISPIRGPCWNLPPPLPIGFSGYGNGNGYGYGGGNYCAVRPPLPF